MGFYDQLAKYYDDIFPLKEETLSCLKSLVTSGRVLDVGCSTGAYATKLSEEDELIVKGIDLNSEMVRLANARKGSASFDVQDMRKIDVKDRYDFIYSIGNTLVHLDDYDEIKEVINTLLKALKKNGTLLIQIVNYARVFRQSITELPEVKNNYLKFSRFYQHKEGMILFKTVLKTKIDRFTSEVLLYPLTKAEIEMIADSLKIDVTFYGSFNKESFKDDSYHLIAVFNK